MSLPLDKTEIHVDTGVRYVSEDGEECDLQWPYGAANSLKNRFDQALGLNLTGSRNICYDSTGQELLLPNVFAPSSSGLMGPYVCWICATQGRPVAFGAFQNLKSHMMNKHAYFVDEPKDKLFTRNNFVCKSIPQYSHVYQDYWCPIDPNQSDPFVVASKASKQNINPPYDYYDWVDIESAKNKQVKEDNSGRQASKKQEQLTTGKQNQAVQEFEEAKKNLEQYKPPRPSSPKPKITASPLPQNNRAQEPVEPVAIKIPAPNRGGPSTPAVGLTREDVRQMLEFNDLKRRVEELSRGAQPLAPIMPAAASAAAPAPAAQPRENEGVIKEWQNLYTKARQDAQAAEDRAAAAQRSEQKAVLQAEKFKAEVEDANKRCKQSLAAAAAPLAPPAPQTAGQCVEMKSRYEAQAIEKQKTIDELQSRINELQESVEALQKAVGTASNKTSKCDTEIAAFEEKIEAMKEKLKDELENAAQAKDQAVEELTEQVQQEIAGREEAIGVLQQQIEELTQYKNDAEKNKERNQEQITGLRTELLSVQKEYLETKQALDSVQNELIGANKDKQEASLKAASRDLSLQTLKKTLAETNNKIEELQSKLNEEQVKSNKCEESKQSIQKKMSENDKEQSNRLAEYEDGLKEKQDTIVKLEQELGKTKDKLAEAKRELKDAVDALIEANPRLEAIRKNIDTETSKI